MPDTTKYLDIDGLTEYHESAGHSADIADGSITTAKLAPYAVTASKITDYAVTEDKLHSNAVTEDKLHSNAVTFGKIDDSAVRLIRDISLIAADSQTSQALTALNFPHRTLTPEQMLKNNEFTNSTNRLCWIKGTFIETAAIAFFGDLQSGHITLYANGVDSTASGKLGVDTSWAIV